MNTPPCPSATYSARVAGRLDDRRLDFLALVGAWLHGDDAAQTCCLFSGGFRLLSLSGVARKLTAIMTPCIFLYFYLT